jgi:hypothetical protein
MTYSKSLPGIITYVKSFSGIDGVTVGVGVAVGDGVGVGIEQETSPQSKTTLKSSKS